MFHASEGPDKCYDVFFGKYVYLKRNISVRLFVCQCLCSLLGLPADKRATGQQPGNTQIFPAIFSDVPNVIQLTSGVIAPSGSQLI